MDAGNILKPALARGALHAIGATTLDGNNIYAPGVFDLTFAASTVAGIYYKQLNAYLVAAVAYLIMTAIASWLLGRLSRRLNVKSKPLGSTSDAKPLSLGTEA